MPSKDSDERYTPDNLFYPLDLIFKFDLDPCSTHENAKCKNHFTKEENGLVQDWTKYKSIFANPPYSHKQVIQWVRKAQQSKVLVVFVLSNDPSTEWYRILTQHVSFSMMHIPNQRFKFGGIETGAKFSTLIAVLWDGFHQQVDAENLHAAIPGITIGPGIWLP